MTTRRLAAILAADVAGFSAMMERDEEGTAARIRTLRREVIEPTLTRHHGRLIKTTGDGFLAEFASPVEAVRSALAIQEQLAVANGVSLRIGINLGDIIIEDDGDVLGDGVNVAARLEQMAEPGGLCISGKIHDEVDRKIDRAFEDRGEQQVKNIARPIRVYALAGAAPSRSEPKTLPLPDKPSIAVLPFTNMSGDPEQEWLADGLSEDIITELSRSRAFWVIARNSSFTYKGRAVDLKSVGRELGARYLVEGSVRRAGERVRITAQLIAADTGAHVWAEKYDCDLAAIFEVQDEITRSIVGSTQSHIFVAEGERARRASSDDLSVWRLTKLGFAECYDLTKASLEKALERGRSVLKLAPCAVEGHQLVACAAHHLVYMGFATDARALAMEALMAARDAVRIDGRHEFSHFVLGMALGTGWRFETDVYPRAKIEAAFRQALHINPNLSLAYGTLATVAASSGDFPAAIANAEMAIRLNPRDPGIVFRWSTLARAYFLQGDFERALEWAHKATSKNADWWQGHAVLVAAKAMVGDLEGARSGVPELIRLAPGPSASNMAELLAQKGEHRAMYQDALLKAGVAERPSSACC